MNSRAHARLRRALRPPGAAVRRLPQSSNFLPEQWTASKAPAALRRRLRHRRLSVRGSNRRAMNPVTGQFLGTDAQASASSARSCRTTGSADQRHRAAGQGHRQDQLHVSGAGLRAAGRRGVGRQGRPAVRRPRRRRPVLRPAAGEQHLQHRQQPAVLAERHGALRAPAGLGSAGLTTVAPPSLTVLQYDNQLPTLVPVERRRADGAAVRERARRSYTGQHSYDTQHTANINAIDLGTAFLPQYQDPTQTPNGVTTSLVNTNLNLVRFYHGYGTSTQNQPIGWRTYHSIQVSWNAAHEERPVVRLQRHDQPVRQAAVAAAAAAQRGRHDHASAPIRRRPTSCSATTTRRRTSCAPTSSGSCRSITSSQHGALKAHRLRRQRLEPGGHLDRRDRSAVHASASATPAAAAT